MLTEHKFKGGARLVVNSQPYGRSVSVGIYVRNGSRDEQTDEGGISHFIEHMLFKGTDNRSAADIAEQMDIMGGQLNAYTTKEYTCYYARVLNDNFSQAADILCDMYFNSRFDDEELKREALVITEEINMYEDTPDELVFDVLQEGIWADNNALGKPILGTEERVKSFVHGDFTAYMDSHYRSDNTVIAVAGNIDVNRVTAVLEQYFDRVWGDSSKAVPYKKAVYVPNKMHRTKDIEQVHLCLTYKGIPVNDERIYTLNVLNTILGGSMSSRLYQTVREKYALAYSIYSYMSCYTDTGIYTVYAAVSPEKEQQATELILNETDGIFKDRITEEVLDKTKLQIKSNYLLGLDSTINLMEACGRNMLLKNTVQDVDYVVNKLDKVTLDDVYALAAEILNRDMLSISSVGR